MNRNSLLVGAGVAALAVTLFLLPAANAETEETTGHETAIKACSTVNPLQPVQVVNAVEDGSGIGFSLVWLKDKDGSLWMCDADANGNVYSYTMLTGDLLDGAGPELIGIDLVSDDGDAKPVEVASKVCAAYLDEGGKVVAAAEDGLPDDPGFLIFVEDTKGSLFLCNATSDAAVWAFEPVGDPIDFSGKEVS
jgi:hypothetical protein